MTGPAIRTREQRILSRQSHRSDRTLDDVRVHLDPTVIEERDQPRPVMERIAHRLREIGHPGDARYLLLQPRMQRFDDRPTSRLPHLSSMFGGMAANLRLDRVEIADAR